MYSFSQLKVPQPKTANRIEPLGAEDYIKNLPDVPGRQLHWYMLTRSTQRPPFWQGSLWHSLICSLQMGPM